MKKDPEIQARKAEIAQTRERLASGVEELKDRVSPENVAQATKETAKDMAEEAIEVVKDGVKQAAHDTKDRVVDAAVRARDGAVELAGDVGTGVRRGVFGFGRAIRDNPVPAAITAMGLGYIIYRAVSDTRETTDAPSDHRGVVATPRYRNEPRGTGARRRNGSGAGTAELRGGSMAGTAQLRSGGDDDEGALERLQGVGQRAKEGASGLADRAMEGGQHAAQWARESGHKAKEGTRTAFVEHPLIFGLGAFAVGLAVGALVPSTDRENELMGDQSDRFLREAKSRAHDAGEVAKEAARKAVAHVDEQLPTGEEGGAIGSESRQGSEARLIPT